MKNNLPNADPFGFGGITNGLAQFFLMSEERFTIKDIGVSYTELNYWDKKELLRSERASEAQWRKFNFFDIVWLNIIREMRVFGIKTDHIKYFKETLFSPIESDDIKSGAKEFLKSGLEGVEEELKEAIKEACLKFIDGKTRADDTLTYFEFWLTTSLVKRIPATLLFFDSGDVRCWLDENEKSNPIETRVLRAQNSHIAIPISKMIDQLIEENLILLYLPELGVLTEQEAEILQMINEKKFDSITVTFRNNAPDMVITKKSTSQEVRTISDTIREGDYQDVRLKIHNKQVRTIINENKIPFSKLGKKK